MIKCASVTVALLALPYLGDAAANRSVSICSYITQGSQGKYGHCCRCVCYHGHLIFILTDDIWCKNAI
jgi:hypothetical protein